MVKAIAVAVALLVLSAAYAAPDGDVQQAPSCKYCGMDRHKFAHSRMLIEYDDRSTVGLCSIHCAAVELANSIDKSPRAIWAADRGTNALVDAEKAVWVLGGDVPGVMTHRAKWAFADRGAAEAFARAHGGTLATFDDAMKGAYEDMYRDTKAIRDRRRARRAGGRPGDAPAAAPSLPAPASAKP